MKRSGEKKQHDCRSSRNFFLTPKKPNMVMHSTCTLEILLTLFVLSSFETGFQNSAFCNIIQTFWMISQCKLAPFCLNNIQQTLAKILYILTYFRLVLKASIGSCSFLLGTKLLKFLLGILVRVLSRVSRK